MFQVLSYKGIKSGTLCVLLRLPSGYNEMGLVRKIKTQMSQLRKDRTGIIGLCFSKTSIFASSKLASGNCSCL